MPITSHLIITAYKTVDFNEYDFGKLVNEEECEGPEGL
jgi:hypothetical protein